MRKQIWIERGSREVWAAAVTVAKEEDMSVSKLVIVALRDYLRRRTLRIKGGTVAR